MAAETVEFPVSEVTKGVTVNVRLTGVTVFTWRIRIATWLMQIAAMILPLPTTFEIDEVSK